MIDVVLASASPRRAELLAGLGVRFEAVAADVDEAPLPGEEAAAMVERLSREKAAKVAAARPAALVVAADTTVVEGGAMLAKPLDVDENRAFLRRLSGRTHVVFTGHALAWDGRRRSFTVRTEVTFRRLTDGEIERYVATGEGLDKAGGYAIQGRGAGLVAGICGCYANVVGMSVAAVIDAARGWGIDLV
ncbi:MAG: Maf family protein [Trueperaceae bacterium]